MFFAKHVIFYSFLYSSAFAAVMYSTTRLIRRTRHCCVSRCSISTRCYTSITNDSVIDIRSDTVTRPSRPMLESALNASLGDDVFGEDPTVIELQERVADMLNQQAALFVPTGTMGNLVSISAHCDISNGAAIIGTSSHVAIWEAGNIANVANVFPQQIVEDYKTGQFDLNTLAASIRNDDDDHYAKTRVVCLENTQNALGGVPLDIDYIKNVKNIVQQYDNVTLHIDGARLWNAAVHNNPDNPNFALSRTGSVADSVTVCLSKGLGAPLGSVVAGSTDFIRLAKRARKRFGGGMRQVGVVAAMGLYALDNHWPNCMIRDQKRAQYLADEMSRRYDIILLRESVTNMVFFKLPDNVDMTAVDFCNALRNEHKVLIGCGYNVAGQSWIRAVMHLDVTDDHVKQILNAVGSVLSKAKQ